MPITEDSVPRPEPNPASVDSGNRTVTNPNRSDPPVKPTHLPKAKSPILGAIRSLLSDPRTYAAAAILAGAFFNSGRGIDTPVTRAGYSAFGLILSSLYCCLTAASYGCNQAHQG